MNKTLAILALVVLSQPVFSQQTDCSDDIKINCYPKEGKPIPPFSKLSCTGDGDLYAIFPKILSYDTYVFNKVQDCHERSKDGYIGTLQFSYCIPSSRKFMKISITDYSLPFYRTPEGKSVITMDMLVFHPSAINLGSRETPKINKKNIVDQQRVFSPRFSPYGGNGDTVEFMGFYKERYFINIRIDDKEKLFTSPEQFELFIKDYVEMLNIK